MKNKGYNYKPISIYLLSAIYFCVPLFKIFFFMWFYKASFSEIFFPILKNYNSWKLANLFLFPVVTSFAIFKVKKWSLPTFLACEASMLIGNIHYINWLRTVGFNEMVPFYYFFSATTFLVTLYFLIPAIRIAYLDPRIRWWEAKPRYTTDIECEIKTKNVTSKGTIINISESGFFLSTDSKVKQNDMIDVSFSYKEESYCLKAEAVYCSERGSGCQIQFTGKDQQKQLKNLTKLLDRNGHDRRPKKRLLP